MYTFITCDNMNNTWEILLQSLLVIVSGEKLTTRLRVQLFKSMMHQTVGWHDEEGHTTGSLAILSFL